MHSRDTGLKQASELPDIFTSYRKSQEPLRERPRPALPRPVKSSLPEFPDPNLIPPQAPPFVEASNLEDLEMRLLAPLGSLLPNPPPFPEDAASASPFRGGETSAWERLRHLIQSGAMTKYNDTRNGLIGSDFSTKLSAFLALGCLSARQIHKELLDFENGANPLYETGEGYGKGENEGTRSVRFELLWRDYMRLCTKKFGHKLFRLSGFRQDASYDKEWKTSDVTAAKPHQKPSPGEIGRIIERFMEGSTGMGLIDASQRELFHTGYTSNRARQNVASFFSKHMGIDWRYGAEWYESMLTDYDVSSNWSNWQYVAGVGNDPRGDARIFNPVKQAFDYDKEGTYVRTWVPEVRGLEKLENVFQPCTASKAELERAGIADHIMVTHPVKRIEFLVDRKPKPPRKPFSRRRPGGRGGRAAGGATDNPSSGSTSGTGSAPSNGSGGAPRESVGHQHQVAGNQAQQPLMAIHVAHAPPYKGMAMNPAGFQPQVFPPAGPYPLQYNDTQWFNGAWDPSGGWGYGGEPLGRGGRRGNSGHNGWGSHGGGHYAGYTPVAPCFPPQNTRPPA